MSRMSYNKIRPGDVRDVGRLNTIWEDFEVADAIDGDNFAEEGLDELAFVPDPEGTRIASIVNNSSTAIAAVTPWATFTMGVAFSTAPLGLIPADSALRIRSYVAFEDTAPLDELLEMRHVHGPGGVLTTILGAESKKRRGQSGGGWPGSSTAFDRGTVVAIESWLTGGFADLQFVRLQYQLTGATPITALHGLLVVHRFDRMTVL